MALPVKVATVGDQDDAYLRPNGSATDNTARSQTRVFSYGGALYTITWDPFGDDDNGSSADYYKFIWNCRKSTDGGATWAEVDAAGRIVGGDSLVCGASDAVVQIGAKLWLVYTYGEHAEVSPGVFGYQFDEIRAVAFDCSTDEWGTPITGGPIREFTDTALDFENLVADACYRGSDEIVVFHRDTDETVSPKRALYSILDVGSGTWTSTDVVVFTSTGAADMEPDKCIHDGSYTHFIARAGLTSASSTSEKKHRTLTGSTLGTEGNMFASWPGTLPSLATKTQPYYGFAAVHDGEVFFAQTADIDVTGAPGFYYTGIIVLRATAGSAAPSWTVDVIGSTAWDSAYEGAPGHSGTPVMVEDSGELYCIHGGSGLYTFPTTYRFSVYAQQYQGSGTWAAPVELWNMQDAYGYGSASRNEAYKFGAIGDLSGSTLARRVGFVASLEQFQSGVNDDDTVYWFRAPLTCCCSNFAY
jgi:hypothetical protein